MSLLTFLSRLNCDEPGVQFSETLALIDSRYQFTPTAFDNGSLHNAANQNNGSCKCFAFAKVMELDERQTLRLFGEHYRQVLATPDAADHQNIRQFMRNGWAGIRYPIIPIELIYS